MRRVLVMAVLLSAAAARADEGGTQQCPKACLCTDAAVPPACGDEQACTDFCVDHDGVSASLRSGWRVKVHPAKKKKSP